MRKVIIALLLFLLSSPVYSLTLDGLRTEIRELTRDDQSTTARQRWDDTELNTRINLAQKDIVAETRCLKARIRVTTVADQREYIMPSIVGEIYRVSYTTSSSTNAYFRLPRLNLQRLDRENSQWDAESSGEPDYYYTRKNRVGLSPPPSSDYVGTNYLQIDCVYIPSDLSDDDDVPFNDWDSLVPYHELIVWKVVWLCCFEKKDYEGMKEARGNYFVGLDRLKKDLKTEEDLMDFGQFKPKFSR